jgi:O-antigen/teichoic acid export membrane protein
MNRIKSFTTSILRNNLAKNSLIVFAGTMIANVSAYLYHLAMGRILGPNGYGELSSLISLLYIFGVPTLVLQTVLVKYFSECKAEAEFGKAKDLFLRSTKLITILLIIFGVILVGSSSWLTGFLHLSNWRLVIWIYLVFCFSTLAVINGSLLQGFQMFVWVAVFASIPSVAKLIISIPLAYNGLEPVILGSLLSGVLAYIFLFFPLGNVLHTKNNKFILTLKQSVSYTIPTFLALLGITSLYSTDIVLAKHFLTASQAGIYSASAVLGKIIFYASSAISIVIFPIVSARQTKHQSVTKVINMALFLVGTVSFVLCLVYGVFPMFVTRMLFGKAFDAIAENLFGFAIFIGIFSLGYILVMVSLALSRTRAWMITVGAALLQIIIIWFFHSGIQQIIQINIIVSFIMLVGMIFYHYSGRHIYKNNY